MTQLLKVSHLQTAFQKDRKEVVSVDDVSFSLKSGETIAIVGESGCGKSVTSLSIMKLLGSNGYVKNGEIEFNGKNIAAASDEEMRKIRGNEISMIFQEPMTSLNPVFSIGNQLIEGIRLHTKMNKKEARIHAIEMLKKVGIPRADEVIDDYPHALSGGMRQRVMIAMALACEPKLLIADEPTTALDVTIQAQILNLMRTLQKEENTAIMLITHDLGVVAEMADKVVVMYAGQIVEEADIYTLFDQPLHPYTRGLMESIPHIEYNENERLASIPGTVPSLDNMPTGCRFQARCPYASEKCTEAQALREVSENHFVRCLLDLRDFTKEVIT